MRRIWLMSIDVAVQVGDGLSATFYVCQKVPDLPSVDTPLKWFDFTNLTERSYVPNQISDSTMRILLCADQEGVGQNLRAPAQGIQHYMDMFDIIFEKEPAAITEDMQAGDERRMRQSAVDQLTIMNSLCFLREYNHLFKSL
ncbi:hypothetical protein BV898_12563 [Hypsibius exemplaris]|uniref:Uncharacterized protein n=1 Tax=Hypsibius exemplaris TaxID=2072580 RepID=A0A1W0WDN5_HYPEX|nr:hypothetical protein BV898_12563 [Hypsibius exemplaris]